MVQGGKQKKSTQNKQHSKRKDKHEAIKKKAAPMTNKCDRIEDNDTLKNFQKKVNDHYKKVYRSIEETIISKAKQNRERFDLI
jgi:hypothetical protein